MQRRLRYKMGINESFYEVKDPIDLNMKFLEALVKVDIPDLHEDARSLLLSQLKRTVGVLGKIIINNDK